MIVFGTLLQMASNFFLALLIVTAIRALYLTFTLRFKESDRTWGWAVKLIPFFLAVKAWQFVDYAVTIYRAKTHGALNADQEWMLTLAIFALLACTAFIICLIYAVFQFFFGKPRFSAANIRKITVFAAWTAFSGLSALFSSYFMTLLGG